MTKLVLAFSMSLDGFVAGPGVGEDQPMGTGGERLHDWMFAKDEDADPLDAEMKREQAERSGAVILGRRTFDVGLGAWEDTPYPVPSFVVTHERREPLAMRSASFTFVADLLEAIDLAKQAAGERDVVVMGADLARQCLAGGWVDEIALQLVPIALGGGTRLFDGVSREFRLDSAQTSRSAVHMRLSPA